MVKDSSLAVLLSSSERVRARWSEASGDVELAVSALRASRDLGAFVRLPNVNKESGVMTFHGNRSIIILTASAVDGAEADAVLIESLDVDSLRG